MVRLLHRLLPASLVIGIVAVYEVLTAIIFCWDHVKQYLGEPLCFVSVPLSSYLTALLLIAAALMLWAGIGAAYGAWVSTQETA